MDYQRRIDDRLLRRVNPASLDDPRAGATGQAGVSGIAQASTFLYLEPWYLPGWSYRARIDIPSGTVGSTMSNFPVYVNGTGMPAELWSAAQASGNDLLVTKADGLTKVAHDLPHFVPGGGAMELHFLADSIPTGAASSWWLYWGNAAAADQRNAAGVWGGDLGRWHLGEASGNRADSTGNGYTATDNIGTDTKVGKLYSAGGDTFDGAADWLSAPAAFSQALSGLGAVAVSLWFKRLGGLGVQQFPLYVVHNAAGSIKLYLEFRTTNVLRVGARPDLGGALKVYDTTAAITDTSSWHKLDAVVDIANDTILIYLDGAPAAGAGATIWTPTSFDGNGDVTGIGARYDGGSGRFNGLIDEVSVAESGLSADWIEAVHLNQYGTTDFYSVTAAQASNLAPAAIIGLTGHGIEGGYLV